MFSIPNAIRLLPAELRLADIAKGCSSTRFPSAFLASVSIVTYTLHYLLFDLLPAEEDQLVIGISHLLSMIALVVAIVVGKFIVDRISSASWRLVSNLLFLLLAVSARTTVLVWALEALADVEPEGQIFRIFGTLTSFGFYGIIGAVYAGSRDQYEKSLENYSKTVQSHRHNIKEYRNQLDLMDRKIRRVVENDLLFSLKSLSSRLQSAAKNSQDMTDYATEVLQDLLLRTKRVILDADRIYRPVADSVPVTFLTGQHKFAQKIPLKSTLAPIASTLLLLFFGAPLGLSIAEPTPMAIFGAVLLGSAILIALPVLALPSKLQISSAGALMVSFGIGALIGVITFFTLNQLYPVQGIDFYLQLTPIPVSALANTTISFAIVMKRQRALILEGVRSLEQEQRRSLELVQQEVWQSKRKWNLLLHGYLQSVLTAAIGRLNQKQGLDTYTVLKEVDRAVQITSQGPEPAMDFALIKQQLIETWEDVCEVEIDISMDAIEVLKSSPVCSESVSEILRESLSNAIRHGNANRFDAKIQRTGNHLVLEAVNNGEHLEEESKEGIGTQIYRELASSFNVENQDNGVKFTAKITI